MTKRLNLIGKVSGRLTVLSESGKYAECTCSCGNQVRILRSNFIAGYTQSCGCLQKDRASKANTKHGKAGTPLYMCWKAMKNRCYNHMHRAYKWYGGKGIKVCDRWVNSFENFSIDMKDDYVKGLTLDRKDSTKDYSKDNCQWLTKTENSKRLSYVQAL